MASITISGGTVFAEGTSVSAYPRTAWGVEGVAGAPSGSATSGPATVTNGVVSFSNLTENTEYIAYASSPNRYKRFIAPSASTPSGTRYLAGPSGRDDVAAINATILAANTAGGGIVQAPVGSVFKVSGPIIVRSNVTLDMRGSTVQFLDTTIRNNLLANAACIPVATATDAATTAASSVVTSPTLAAVAVVGQQLAVVGAGPDGGVNPAGTGPIWLYGTVLSVAGNNITLTGNVNGVAAHRTLSGATAYLFNRDKNIRILGGTWDMGTNWNVQADRYTAAFLSNPLRLRRVDGLTVEGAEIKQTSFPQGGGWCFGVNPGDCTDFLIEDITANGSSVAVEGDGPLQRGVIRNIRGQSQDDQVALGTVGAAGADLEGDITDVLIDGVTANGSLRALTLFAGQGSNGAVRPMTGVMGRSLKGRTIVESVRVVNYAGNATIDCELADVTALPSDYPTHKRYQVTATSSQPNLKVRGPNTGQDLLAPAITTANQLSIGTGATDTALLLTLEAPPSGALWLEAFVYTMQQRTSAGLPTLNIADMTGGSLVANLLTINEGTMAIDALTPSFNGRVKVTGLTPGATYTYRVRAKTTAGTVDFLASATTPAHLRAVIAAP